MTVSPWWETWAGRLEYELKALEAADIRYTLDDTARAEGFIRLNVKAPDELTGIGEVPLVVTFPDFYPFMRPDVRAPELELGHHQHPFGKNLCLIGRASRWWETTDTLSWLLTSQLRTALGASSATASRPGVEPIEEDQGEPVGAYYEYAPNALMLIDSQWAVPADVRSGPAHFAIAGAIPPGYDGTRLLGALISVRSESGDAVLTLPESLQQIFNGQRVEGRWSYIDPAVRSNHAAEIWAAAERADPRTTTAASVSDGRGGTVTVELRAVAFPEERSRSELGDGWIFLIKERGLSRDQRRKVARQTKTAAAMPSGATRYHLIRPGRAGTTDMVARVPELDGLAGKHVAVVGCGALGSSVVDHLARAGVATFTLIDKDVLEPGNLVRHGATMHHIGVHKAVAAAQMVMERNPHAHVEPVIMSVGGPRRDGEESQLEQLARICERTNVLVDATAEVGVQEILARLARTAGTPYVMLEAANGAWGGTVACIAPDSHWCHACFQRHRLDETLPLPPAASTGLTQPAGCAEPTFTGSGFDLAEVSLQAVRTVVARLLSGVAGAYPQDGADVAVLTLRNQSGRRALPTWKGYTLERHPSCRAH